MEMNIEARALQLGDVIVGHGASCRLVVFGLKWSEKGSVGFVTVNLGQLDEETFRASDKLDIERELSPTGPKVYTHEDQVPDGFYIRTQSSPDPAEATDVYTEIYEPVLGWATVVIGGEDIELSRKRAQLVLRHRLPTVDRWLVAVNDASNTLHVWLAEKP